MTGYFNHTALIKSTPIPQKSEMANLPVSI